LNRVSFASSTDAGANWSPLGTGVRAGTTANWQLDGLALPAAGLIRARGVPAAGGSAGIVEQITTYSLSPDSDNDGLLDSWERTYWPTIAGHSAPDDFDGDGWNELLELALGLDPTVPNDGGLPAVTVEGGYLTMTISKQHGADYEVQSAGTVLPGMPDSFSAATTVLLVNDPATLKVRDQIAVGDAAARFIRLKVIAAP
jgi:hypothetical protein